MYARIAYILKRSTFIIWVKWTTSILVGLVIVFNSSRCESIVTIVNRILETRPINTGLGLLQIFKVKKFKNIILMGQKQIGQPYDPSVCVFGGIPKNIA
jgi:hypothetical protein